MRSSLPSPRPQPSSLSHSPTQFLQTCAVSVLPNHNEIQQGTLPNFPTLQPFSKYSSKRTPFRALSLVTKNQLLYPKDASNFTNKIRTTQNTNLHVQNFVDRIKQLPATHRMKILDMVNKENGFQIQTISDFNARLVALVTAGELEIALELYSKLSSYELIPTSWTHSIMVRCYCKKNEPIEAKRVLDLMIENGFQPNASTFNLLINSFCKKGMLRKAYQVFGTMSQQGCEPSITTYNCLLKGLCYVGRVEEAYEVLNNIKKSLLKPDIYTYTAVMNGFCKVGRSNEAMELLDEALEMGLTPNVVTFNTLFNGYFKEGRPLEGIGLLNKMKKRDCVPDYISYSTLLHGLLKWGEIKAALLIYEEMVGNGFEVDERMMNTLLRGLCMRCKKETGLLKYAHKVFEKMRNGVCVIYPCTVELVNESLY